MDYLAAGLTLFTGQRVALTGRLASMTREKAAALIVQLGGQYARAVHRTTAMLVIGTHGWPLETNARLSKKLRRARELQRRGMPIELVTEEDFLTRAGIYTAIDAPRRTYSLAEVVAMTDSTRDRILTLTSAHVIEPLEWRSGVPFFDFVDVARLKSLLALVRAGARLIDIRRSLQRLAELIPEATSSVNTLHVLQGWGTEIVTRTPDGQLMAASGQRMLDFDTPAHSVAIPIEDDLFDRALRCEAHGEHEAAAAAYEQLLLNDGADPEICFQLGNALYHLNRLDAAAQRFRQTVELEADHAQAWNNLACVLADSGRAEDAIEPYRNAVALEPDWPDPRYGLADVLDEVGKWEEAWDHWQTLLSLECGDEYANYARARLDHIRRKSTL